MAEAVEGRGLTSIAVEAIGLLDPRRLGTRWLRQCALSALPATATLIWLAYVLFAGELDRVGQHWESSITMIFGSFLAGSSPEGGGAVAFPIFTKVLEVPAEVARSFSLSIQAVGMTMASLIILLARRPIDPQVGIVCIPAGILGFLASLFLLGDEQAPFWPGDLSPAFIKVTFTIILAAMSFMMFVSLRSRERGTERVRHWNPRVVLGLGLAAFLGGGVTAWVGTGVNVMLFLFAVVMAGLHPRVGVPTSILTMATISIVGLLTLGIADGQLDLGLNAGRDVVSVGGQSVGPLEGSRYDLTGLWLAAVPIVVWGAPLGTWVVHILHENRLIVFVGLLALTEVISTAILLDDLHEDGALIAYFVLGMLVAIGGILLAKRYRRSILALPPDAPSLASRVGTGP